MPLSLALFRWFFRSLFQVFKSLIFLTTSLYWAADESCASCFRLKASGLQD